MAKAESPRDRRLAGLGVELFDAPRKTPTRSLEEGDVWAITDSPFAQAHILAERTETGGAKCVAVCHDGQLKKNVVWEKLKHSEVYLIGRFD